MVSLKSAHLYRRVPTDLSKATHTGGAVSLVAVGCIVALLVSNLQSFYRINVERSLEIDQVYDESIVVSFNLTLPRLPCALTSLDLTDAVGTSVHNVTRGLTKMRIDEATDQKLLSHTDTRWMRPNPTPDIRGQELCAAPLTRPRTSQRSAAHAPDLHASGYPAPHPTPSASAPRQHGPPAASHRRALSLALAARALPQARPHPAKRRALRRRRG